MLQKLEHPDLHFTYPTIKLPSMKSDYKPVSDDFANEWHELVMQSPYFTMEEWMEAMGITIPIIPGIKPMAKLSQLTVVPKTFHCDIPEPLAREIVKCKTDEDAKALGIEWTTAQCQELYGHGVQNIHFYTVSAVDSVAEVARRLL